MSFEFLTSSKYLNIPLEKLAVSVLPVMLMRF
jgi:hypothetical protein